jgi:antitoxin CptB|tara:strand:+ start:137 stop:394 length:258 start_codon:yes stop_codon:yes gene_type:complete
MENIKTLKKKIIYRAVHRGTKEMDLLLGHFVLKYIDTFNDKELMELKILLNKEDEIIYNWYFDRKNKVSFPVNRVTKKFKNFKVC